MIIYRFSDGSTKIYEERVESKSTHKLDAVGEEDITILSIIKISEVSRIKNHQCIFLGIRILILSYR